MIHVKEKISEEELVKWCRENLQVIDSFSSMYEFEAESDFLINEFEDEFLDEAKIEKNGNGTMCEFTEIDFDNDEKRKNSFMDDFDDESKNVELNDEFYENIAGDYDE